MAKPLQVYLDDDDLERLERWSRECGLTKSDAVRTAIRLVTQKPAADPLMQLSGILVGGLPRDVSENVDRYLNETYVAERAAGYGRRKTGQKRIRR